MGASFACYPATPERWGDIERLFGARGACAGCWCMYFRQTGAQFNAMRGEQNREAMRELVELGETPGLLAYDGERPVGWVAVAPRADYPRLQRSRILKPVDDAPVWSVTCFFVDRAYRRKGLTVRLLRAAVEYVKERGGRIVEGYPVDPDGQYPDTYAYVGVVGAFRKAGFQEVARPSGSRAVMRYTIAQ